MKFALPISFLAGITCVQAFAPSIHKYHDRHVQPHHKIPTFLQMSSSTLPEASSMRVGELKKELESYGMSSKIYLEKSELVEAVEKARAEGKKPRSTSSASTESSSSSTESREERLAKEMENCKAMKAGELKKELESYGISTSSFFEKSEFVKACAEARVDGKKKTGGSDEEGFAEYSAADVEVLTDDSAGPRPKGQKQESQSARGGNPFGGAPGGNPFGGMGGMGNMADMFGGAAGGGSPFGGGMGGMGGMADMLKNMGMGGGAPGASPFGGAGGGDAFAQAQKMMQNPKVMEIMAKAQSNPKIMKAMQECMSNPAAFAKYQNDPEKRNFLLFIFYITMSSKSASHNTVSDIITKGFLERGVKYAAIGFTGGLMASLVLAAGGKGTASRKAITAFGTGIGLGSAWTKTNIELEETLGKN